MGNPYYVQPQSSLGDIIDPMLKVAAFQQGQRSLEQHAEQLAEAKRVNQIQHGIGTPGTPDFVPGTEQQKIELSRQQLRQQGANIPIHRQNFGVIEARTISNKLNTLGVKKENPMLAEIDNLGKDPTVGNYQAYEYFTSAYPQYRDSIMSEIADDYVRKMDKDPNYANTEQGKQQKAFVDAISQDPTGEKIFSHVFAQTLASKQAEDEGSKLEAKIALANPDIRAYNSFKAKGASLFPNDPIKADLYATEQYGNWKAKTTKEGKFAPTISIGGEKPGVVAERERKAKRQEAMDVANSEAIILSKDNPDEVKTGHVDIFNQYANKPYVYQWKDNSRYIGGKKVWDSGRYEKVRLPVINKKQVTARDVYNTAEKHGMTYDEVLTQIMGTK